MTRTAINIIGNAVCTIIVAKQEGLFDQKVFNSNEELTVFGEDAHTV